MYNQWRHKADLIQIWVTLVKMQDNSDSASVSKRGKLLFLQPRQRNRTPLFVVLFFTISFIIVFPRTLILKREIGKTEWSKLKSRNLCRQVVKFCIPLGSKETLLAQRRDFKARKWTKKNSSKVSKFYLDIIILTIITRIDVIMWACISLQNSIFLFQKQKQKNVS